MPPVIPIARPLMGDEEKELVWSALESGQLAQGPRVREFEEEFAEFVGVPHAIATSSGTTALHVALLALGVGAGDEVVTVAHTFVASANAILYTGARPVFVDVDPVSYTMDVAQAEAAIGPRTKAIMPVHLYGNPADLPALADLAERRGIALVEDACQAHGAAYAGRACGAWGTGAFSFYPTKNMTTGEGGMITTTDPQLADRSRLLREHGMRVRYHHDVYGFNFRMTDIHASIGLAQLRKLPAYNARRREIASRYTAALRGVITPQVRPEARHVFHQYTIVVRERDRFASMLAERGIGTAIYYPIPVHRQKSYLALGYGDQRLPITERLTEEILSIPVHPALTDAEVDTVIEAVNEVAAALGPVAAETSAIG